MKKNHKSLAALFALVAMIALTFTTRASADEGEDLDVKGEPPPKLAPGSVKIFDGRRSTYALEAAGGTQWFRGVHDNDFKQGVFDARIGQVVTTQKYPFFLSGTRFFSFRMMDDKSYVFSVMHEIAGAVALGPLEPEVRIGFNLLNLDVFHGSYNASLISPRVAAGAGLKLGKIRLDFQVYSEYLWRWFGESYFVRGVVFGVSLDRPRLERGNFTDRDKTSPFLGPGSLSGGGS